MAKSRRAWHRIRRDHSIGREGLNRRSDPARSAREAAWRRTALMRWNRSSCHQVSLFSSCRTCSGVRALAFPRKAKIVSGGHNLARTHVSAGCASVALAARWTPEQVRGDAGYNVTNFRFGCLEKSGSPAARRTWEFGVNGTSRAASVDCDARPG